MYNRRIAETGSIFFIHRGVLVVPLDFFEATKKNMSSLNQTERQLFDHVVKNMDKVKNMSIQKFAANRYLSTTTIFRFTQKLGFSGYSEFINSLLVTAHQNQHLEIPEVMHNKVYSDEYLKNVFEAVRVMPENKIIQVHKLLDRHPNVYILTDEDTNSIGRYCEKLFMGMGLRTYFPEAAYQTKAVLDLIEDDDLLIVLSYYGQESALIDTVERIFLKRKPFLLSVTRADNNVIQNISDVNFYIFADEIHMHGINLTSHVSILMILELLIYGYIAKPA